MKTQLRAALLMSLVVFGIRADGADGAKADLKMMEGTWVPVSGELAGKPLPEETRKTTKLIIKGDKYIVRVGELSDEGILKLDPSKNPKAMDITGTEGPNKSKTFLCIYELKDDNLKVCYDVSGKERPTEFKTKKD